jgi:moderate conductance mechanosensitive channel
MSRLTLPVIRPRSRHSLLSALPVAFVFVCGLVLVAPSLASAAAPAAGSANAASSAAAPVALTPEQAHDALQVLNDPKRRAQLEDTLRAIAVAGALATPPSSAAASAPQASSAPARALASALQTNGLVSEISHHITGSVATLGDRLGLSLSALLDFPSTRDWWARQLSSQQGRTVLLSLLRLLIACWIPALLAEALVSRAIRRARAAVASGTTTIGAHPAADATSDSAHTQQATHHWNRLRVLPNALLYTLLSALPLVAFALCASVLLSALGDAGSPATKAVDALIDVYVVSRAVLLVCALFFAPNATKLRLFRLSDRWAQFAQRWARRVVIVAAVGGALNAATQIGMTEDAHQALIKLVALAVHLMVAVAILQCRHPVAQTIRRWASKYPSLAYFGHWIADIWAGTAVFLIIALWLVWALDVHNGYRMLLHLGGMSLGVLLGARVVAIVAFGALGRIFDRGDDDATISVAQRRAYRYYPVLRRIMSIVVGIVTFTVLLDIWGLPVWHFLLHNPIGHRLGSALSTIIVAALIAIVAWEMMNVAAERRLDAWNRGGDFVRAARLRTLLPMLRTTLFIAILLVVGLTALSEFGVNTGPLVAGASIFGVALGFGSQKLVQDFITGIFLLMENAMQVGDWVTLAGVSGSVEYLSIRTVRLRGGDGSLHIVPFSSVTSVNNTNRGIGNAAVKVAIATGADVAFAIETLTEIGRDLREDDKFKDGILADFSFWGVDQVDGASVTLVGQIQCRDTSRWPVQREFNRRVLDRFTERGIQLANPQRNFVIHDTSRRQSAPAPRDSDARSQVRERS